MGPQEQGQEQEQEQGREEGERGEGGERGERGREWSPERVRRVVGDGDAVAANGDEGDDRWYDGEDGSSVVDAGCWWW